jgi:hypothetical protein
VTPIIFPWPARVLHPNARTHWAAKAKAAKAARLEGWAMAHQAGWDRERWPEGRLHLWLDFYPPDHRRRDDDGLLTCAKPWRDGIADAIGIDDVHFVSHPYVRDEVRKGGQVVVRLTPEG